MRTANLSLVLLPLFLTVATPALSQATLEPSADSTLYEDDFGDLANGPRRKRVRWGQLQW